jgi:mannobiose 2-epimerase
MLIEDVKKHLEEVIIPFWHNMKDEVYGGYYGERDFDLKLYKEAPKGCILNSRILWFFSNAYKLLREPFLLEDARHAYTFMIEHCIDYKNGGVYWSVNYDGSVCSDVKYTYNMAFAIYALSSYYDISKDENAINIAKDLFNIIESKCRDEVGYLEAFDGAFQLIQNDELSENGVIAHKTMNTFLHVFEAYTELYRVTKTPLVAKKLKWIMNIFADKIYNPEQQRQEVFFDKSMNSIIDLHSYGHDIETAWLIDWGCEVLGEKAYINKMMQITKALTQKIYEVGFDGHSVLNECCRGNVNTSRIWWVQAEAMVGFMNGYQKDLLKTEYLYAVKNIWEYIKTYLVDPRPGSEWFWEVDEFGNPGSKKSIVEPWKCPYHNGRMCFEIIRRNVDVA